MKKLCFVALILCACTTPQTGERGKAIAKVKSKGWSFVDAIVDIATRSATNYATKKLEGYAK